MERKTIRRRILFYGRVQGVGFRYRARYAAESLCLTGWVYNEEDGTVTKRYRKKITVVLSLVLRHL